MKKKSELTATFFGLWDSPLRAEGFGRVNSLDRTKEPDVSVEIENLIEYQRLVSFAKTSEYDVDNRERFLIDFVSNVFTEETLEKSIIPKRSIVPKTLNNVAMLYKQNPERWLAGEKDVHPDDEAYQAIARSSGLNATMKRSYYWALCTNLVMVMPRVTQTKRGPKLDYIVRTPSSFRVLLSDSGDVEKLLYSTEIYGGEVSPENAVVVWTPDEVYIRDVAGNQKPLAGNEGMVNPYGRIPAVFIQLEEDESSIYTGGAWDLTEAALRVNFYELLLQDDLMMDAMGVWLAKNMSLSESSVLSPRKVYAYESIQDVEGADIPPELANISGTPNAQLIYDMMSALAKDAAINEGISPAMLETQVRELSGRALKIMQQELLDRRANDAERMEWFERELYGITAQVVENAKRAGEWPGEVITTDEEVFQIDFSENTESDLDEDKRLKMERELVNDGILSPVDWYMRYNSDVTDEKEILDRIKKNKQLAQSLMGAGLKGSLLEMVEQLNEEPKDPEQNTLDQIQ